MNKPFAYSLGLIRHLSTVVFLVVSVCSETVTAQTSVQGLVATRGAGEVGSSSYTLNGRISEYSHQSLPASSIYTLAPSALGPMNTSDSDSDGVPDIYDAFPDDPAASVDSDGDGAPDDWNEDATDAQIAASSLVLDAFPSDASETADTDGDGVGNNADTDDDNDGYSDEEELRAGSDPLDSSSTPEDNVAEPLPGWLIYILSAASGFG